MIGRKNKTKIIIKTALKENGKEIYLVGNLKEGDLFGFINDPRTYVATSGPFINKAGDPDIRHEPTSFDMFSVIK